MTSDPSSRRQFLESLGFAAAAGVISDGAAKASDGMPADPPRDLKPTGANLGSLFPDVEIGAGRFQVARRIGGHAVGFR